MPLQLKEPTFDRSFDDIYRDIRSRIPQFNPQWTNFNDSDPGITVLQLFAWLTELTLHRMNDVPRKNYLKFAQLLGLELTPPKPATVRLSFTPKATEPADTIPVRARFGAQANGKPVVFETTEALDIISAPLAAMVVFGDGGVVKIETANSDPQPFYPLGRNPAVGSALYLGFKPTPAAVRPFPLKMRFLALRPAVDTAGSPLRVGDQDLQLIPPVDLVWEYRPKKDQDVWERLNVFQDKTAALTRDGFIDVEGPDTIEFGIEPSLKTLITDPLYWLRIRLDENRYPAGQSPRLERFVPNAVDAVNLETELETLLGTSSGRPDQQFTFPAMPVEAESLALVTRDPAGLSTSWERRDDFFSSTKSDYHFVLEAASGTVTFGDGERGVIPPAGLDVVATLWRHGGGSAGNAVGAGAVKTLITPVVGVEKVTNLRPATGGADEQDVDDFIKHAPSELLSGNRAVTEKDFRAVALSIDGVEKARAVGGRHPDFPDIDVPGSVTVFLVAKTDAMPPKPSAELIRSVCMALDQVRLITSEVYVSGPTFIEIRVEARLLAAPNAAFDAVAEDARKRLDDYLSPVARGFGENVSPAALYGRLYADPGSQVRSVEDLLVYVNGLPHDIGKQIEVAPDALVYPGAHIVVVRPDTDRFGS